MRLFNLCSHTVFLILVQDPLMIMFFLSFTSKRPTFKCPTLPTTGVVKLRTIHRASHKLYSYCKTRGSNWFSQTRVMLKSVVSSCGIFCVRVFQPRELFLINYQHQTTTSEAVMNRFSYMFDFKRWPLIFTRFFVLFSINDSNFQHSFINTQEEQDLWINQVGIFTS